MWGQIIGAGISAIGSLLGGGDEETTTSTVNYSEMVKKAEKAGFNPLTAIRNGGSAGFTSTTHHPALSASIGNAAGAIGNAIASFDPHAEQKQEMEFRLAEAQLANLNADTASRQRTWFGSVPTYSAGVMRRMPTGNPASSGYAAGTAALTAPGNPQPGTPYFGLPTTAPKDDIPLWKANVDRDGKRGWGPNPDGPDIEQLAYVAAMRSMGGYEAAARTIVQDEPYVKVTKAPVNRQNAGQGPNPGAAGSWWPSFSFSW